MEIVRETNLFYVLRLSFGEEVRKELESFCKARRIGAAWLNAIGASKELEIACYNLNKKQYDTREFKEMLEVVGIIGNISIKDGSPFLHAHGTFARPSMEVIGGHIMKCVISATCEIWLKKIDGRIERKHDDFTGLHLMCS